MYILCFPSVGKHTIKQGIHHLHWFGRTQIVASMSLILIIKEKFQLNNRYANIFISSSNLIMRTLLGFDFFSLLLNQVVLELLDDGRLATSDDPPVIFGCLNGEFIQKVKSILMS